MKNVILFLLNMVSFFTLPLVYMWAWNGMVMEVLDFSRITYFQALAISIMLKVLFMNPKSYYKREMIYNAVVPTAADDAGVFSQSIISIVLPLLYFGLAGGLFYLTYWSLG